MKNKKSILYKISKLSILSIFNKISNLRNISKKYILSKITLTYFTYLTFFIGFLGVKIRTQRKSSCPFCNAKGSLKEIFSEFKCSSCQNIWLVDSKNQIIQQNKNGEKNECI